MKQKKLGVNIDHIATIRQARKAEYPDPVAAAAIAEMSGADSITVHLREDRRHIQDRDVLLLRQTIQTRMNLEMAVCEEIIEIALRVKPEEVCLVPERREEVTTEGGLDAAGQMEKIKNAVSRLQDAGIAVSLFIDPEIRQIEAAAKIGSRMVELHTGKYSDALREHQTTELLKLKKSAKAASEMGLIVNAGHGLHYQNTLPVAAIPEIETFNIGHSIISRAVLVGLDRAVLDMVSIIRRAEGGASF